MQHFLKLFLLFPALFLLSLTGIAQTDFCSSRNMSYKEGEKLSFRAYYNMGILWIIAGNATITVSNETYKGQKAYHIIGDGKTAKSYEWFFKVNDRYETYVEKENMLPMKFIRNVSEGNIKIKNNVTFYQSSGKALSDTSTFKIPKCSQDILSAIYYARNIDYDNYKPGDKIPFNLFLDNKVYNLYIKYVGKEVIKTKMGTYNAIKIVPRLIQGSIFKDDDKMTIWVTDDENHLPLRVSSPILVGSVKVDLVGYDNLRNPFSSMISEQ